MTDVAARVRALLPSVRADLEDLVRIESVWADPARRPEVYRSAELTAKLLSEAGFEDIQTVEAGGAPAVMWRSEAFRRTTSRRISEKSRFMPIDVSAPGDRT